MLIYIASSLKYIGEVLALAQAARERGHEILDWTQAGPPSLLRGQDFPELADLTSTAFVRHPNVTAVSSENLRLLHKAEVMCLLLPSGASAHFEYGVAYALRKPCLGL